METIILPNHFYHKGLNPRRSTKYLQKIIYLLSLIFICQSLKAAPDTLLNLQPVNTIKGNFSNFFVDNLGNIFLLTSSNQIKKLNNNLDSVAIFNESKLYGDIYSIDVSNPLKVLVYYRDFNTILMLDRQLTTLNTIDIRQQNLFQVKAIAQSYDNNIWVFDEVDNKLKKIDENGNLLLETPDFRLLFDSSYIPHTIIDMNGLLYLYSARGGWKIFDYYGGLKTQYPALNWRDVQVSDAFLEGHDSTYFYAERPKDLQFFKTKPNLNLANTRKIIQMQNLYYFLTKDGINIYREVAKQ